MQGLQKFSEKTNLFRSGSTQLYSWTYSQLSGLGELPLLDVDGLVEDLVPGGLGLHQLEAVKVVEGAPLLGGRHPLGPRGRRPLPGDVLRLPRLAHHARPRRERELGL